MPRDSIDVELTTGADFCVRPVDVGMYTVELGAALEIVPIDDLRLMRDLLIELLTDD